MAGFNKVDSRTKAERVYKVSLLLRRKPLKFIIEYITKEWKIERAQAYKYIKEARKEWLKYFEKLKGDGISYHIAQIRDLKDQAYSRKVVVGTVKNKQVIQVPDLGLVLDITKEEAKLMGIYPAEKHEEIRKVIILGKKDKKNNEKKDKWGNTIKDKKND